MTKKQKLLVTVLAGACTVGSAQQALLTITPGTLGTVAGTGTASHVDGSASIATFNQPFSMRANVSGDIVVADSSNYIRLYKANSATVSTIAGTGIASYSGDGGSAISAAVNAVRGTAIDAAGDVFLGDTGNNRVRMIYEGGASAAALIAATNQSVTPVIGNIYTIAGNGTTTAGTANTLATSQGLNSPRGLWVDISGNLFIASYSNNKIFVVYAGGPGVSNLIKLENTAVASPTVGYMYALVGTGIGGSTGDGGLGTAATINGTPDVAVDGSGNVFALEQAGNRLRKLDGSTGKISTVAGNGTAAYAGDGGPGTSAELNAPRGVTVDAAGNVYVADTSNSVVRKIDGSGVITTVAGNNKLASSPDGGNATASSIYQPYEVSIDPSGNLLIDEETVSKIRKVTITSAAFAYGSVALGTQSAGQIIVVNNAGASALTLSGVVIPTGYSQVASGGTDCGQTTTLVPAASCNVDVVFEPTSSQAYSGTVTIFSNGGTGSMTVSGTGVVGSTSATLTTSTPLVAPGATALLNVTVSSSAGTPTGTVQFVDGTSTILCTSTLNAGLATCSTNTLSGGSHTIVAKYGGTTGFTSTSSNAVSVLVQNPNAVSSTLIVTATPATVPSGQSVTLTAMVTSAGSNTPTGTVTFADNGVVVGTAAIAAGVAAYVESNPSAGPHAVNATYPGDNSTLPSSSATPASYAVLSSYGAVVPGVLSTVVGTGVGGHGGDGTAAKNATITQPLVIRADASNNWYITGMDNYVRKVTAATGNISTIAGTGAAGFSGDGGAATSAVLNVARGLAVDGSGDVFLADSGNNRVREVYAGGVIGAALIVAENPTVTSPVVGSIYTIAGGGTGATGTLATLQPLASPRALAVDLYGSVYIADISSARVRVIYMGGATLARLITLENPTVTSPVVGNMYVLAGNGTVSTTGDGGLATSATMNQPHGVAVDLNGNVYIAEYGGQVVRKVSASTGLISTVAGKAGVASYTGDGGPATSATLNLPRSVWVDSGGALYIADMQNQAVRRVDISGVITTVAGNGTATTGSTATNGDGGVATTGVFGLPYDVTQDTAGNLLVADLNDNRIRSVNAASSIMTFGSQPVGQATTLAIAVTATGNAPLNITAVTIPNGFAQATGGTGDCAVGTPVQAGSECSMRISLSGSQSGVFAGQAQIVTDALNLPSGTMTVQLTGSSVYPNTIAATVTLSTPLASGQGIDAGDSLILATTVANGTGTSAATPTGTVIFQLTTGQQLGSAQLVNGKASLTTKSLPVGTANIYALYQGDMVYQPAASTNVAVTVYTGPGDFALSVLPNTPQSITVQSGSSGVYALVLTSFAGFEQAVQLSCSSLPANSNCVFGPGTFAALNSIQTKFGLSINTSGNTASMSKRKTGGIQGAIYLCMLCLIAPIWTQRKRRKLGAGLLTLMVLAGGVFLSGCSSDAVPSGSATPAGTYTVTVTATSAAATHSINLTLVVQ